jgi:hypothetical protein
MIAGVQIASVVPAVEPASLEQDTGSMPRLRPEQMAGVSLKPTNLHLTYAETYTLNPLIISYL